MIKITGFISLIALASLVFLPSAQVEAASFNKNRLIDDSLFTDTDSMTVSEIQSFLDSNGSLLANWVDDVNMRRPSDNCIVHHATGMTAAEIIHEAATAWGAQVYDSNGCAISGAYWSDPAYSNYTLETVSPKALLVTLQKEQSLISANGGYSSDPNDYKSPACCSSNEYKLARAMGYGVPDSGGINEKYLGFYNQINWAAWQFRYNFERSAGNTAWDEVSYLTYTGPMIEGTFRRCGSCSLESFDGYYPIDGSPLYMENRSTASLYFYTPHTYPGFFGNYNFVQFYSDWFGSVYANSLAYTYHSQTANPTLKQGFGNNAKLRLRNNGSESWYDLSGLAGAPVGTNPIYLSTDSPFKRSSVFKETWESKSTPVKEFNAVYESDGITLSADQDMVAPGQVAEFDIRFEADQSLAPGTYQEFFTLKQAGEGTRLSGGQVWINVKVQAADYSASLVGQTAHPTLENEEVKNVILRYENTGNVDWYDASGKQDGVSNISLATVKPLNRKSDLNRLWTNPKRPAGYEFSAVYENDGTTLSANQDRVQPGQIAEFAFSFSATKRATEQIYKEHFKLVREGFSNPLFGPLTWFNVNYTPGTYIANFNGQSSHPTIADGSASTFMIRYKNNGTARWYDKESVPADIAPILIGTKRALNRSSDFSATWTKSNRPTRSFTTVYESDGITLAADQDIVEPGQIAEFEYDLTVPNGYTPDKYREDFFLFKNGAKEFEFESNTRFWTYITVP